MTFEEQKQFLQTKIQALTDEAASLQAILDNLDEGYSVPLASLDAIMLERDTLKSEKQSLEEQVATLTTTESQPIDETPVEVTP